MTENATCFTPVTCVTLRVAVDGDVSAVYSTSPGGSLADVWLMRQDAASGEWSSPQRLAQYVSGYQEWAHSTAM